MPTGRVLFADICHEIGSSGPALDYHARLLVEAGLVSVAKLYNGSIGQNWFSLTPKGRAVLAELRQSLDFAAEAQLAS